MNVHSWILVCLESDFELCFYQKICPKSCLANFTVKKRESPLFVLRAWLILVEFNNFIQASIYSYFVYPNSKSGSNWKEKETISIRKLLRKQPISRGTGFLAFNKIQGIDMQLKDRENSSHQVPLIPLGFFVHLCPTKTCGCIVPLITRTLERGLVMSLCLKQWSLHIPIYHIWGLLCIFIP